MFVVLTFRDLDKDGKVDAKDLPKICIGLGEAAGYDQVLNTFRDGRPANPTQATLEEFIKVWLCFDIFVLSHLL